MSTAFSGASALTTGSATHDLFTAVDVGGGRKVFRKVFGLRVHTGGLADDVRFDVANANCNITFSTRDFDAKGGSTPQVAIEQKGGQALAVTLPAPMQLRSINFSGASPTEVEIYRMDGDVLAGDPTKTFADNANVPGDFTDLRFGIKRKNSSGYLNIDDDALTQVDVRGFPTSARVGLAEIPASGQPITPSFFFVIPGEVGRPDGPSGSASIGQQLADALQQHFAALQPPYPATVDLLLIAESDSPCRFQASTFVIPFGLVRSSFRAVLLRAKDITDARGFATRLREGSNPFAAYLRSKLNAQTQQALARLDGAAIPDPVLASMLQQLNIAMQSEAFYHADRFGPDELKPETVAAASGATGIVRTRVNRTVLEEAFPREVAAIAPPDDADKEVLRAQGANSSLAVHVDVPRPITIRNATLRLEGDVRGDAPNITTTSEDSIGVTAPSWDAPIPDTVGFSVDAQRSVAALVTPALALEASGVAAALSLTSTSAELVAELREDQAGIPNGRILASASVAVDQLDRPAWIRFEFPRAVVVKAAACWLVLRAISGSAVWLADQATPGTVRVGDPAPKGWIDRGEFKDRTLLHQIWTRTASATSTSSNSTTPDVSERLRVAIGSAVLTPGTNDGSKVRTVDIKVALQNLIGAVSGGQLVSAPIRVSALGTGNITVYPPEIEYDVTV